MMIFIFFSIFEKKACRVVFHSLSEETSSEMPRRTEVPGTTLSTHKPGAKIQKNIK